MFTAAKSYIHWRIPARRRDARRPAVMAGGASSSRHYARRNVGREPTSQRCVHLRENQSSAFTILHIRQNIPVNDRSRIRCATVDAVEYYA